MWDLKHSILCCLLNVAGSVWGALVSAELAKLCSDDTITAATTAISLSHCVNALQHCTARSISACDLFLHLCSPPLPYWWTSFAAGLTSAELEGHLVPFRNEFSSLESVEIWYHSTACRHQMPLVF